MSERPVGELQFGWNNVPNLLFYEPRDIRPNTVFYLYEKERETLREDSDIEDAIIISEKTPPYTEGGLIQGASIEGPIQGDLYAGDYLPEGTSDTIHRDHIHRDAQHSKHIGDAHSVEVGHRGTASDDPPDTLNTVVYV